jgi:hypothetical protein
MKTKRIKQVHPRESPVVVSGHGTVYAGEELEVSAERAERLLAGGFFEEIEKPTAQKKKKQNTEAD